MDFSFLHCVVLCLLRLGQAALVTQNPRYHVVKTGDTVNLSCSQNQKHKVMYWYQQRLNQAPKLLLYYYDDQLNKERDTSDHFQSKRPNNSFCSLEIRSTDLGDSAVYLCASSIKPNYAEQIFGAGSRLTVLDNLNKVRLPNVAIFEPSEAEINHTQKATLVCLARDFYPDHVELTWWVNGKEVHSGVITDPEPYQKDPSQKDSSYYLSSRLRVSAAFWHNARNHFRCQVQFYGISEDDTWEDARRPKPVTQNISAGLWGRADCGMTSVSYQQGIMSATLLYEVLLGKAILYAVLVSGLVLIGVIKTKNS